MQSWCGQNLLVADIDSALRDDKKKSRRLPLLTAIIAIATPLLVPIPALLIDLLLIFAICLILAVVVIAASTRQVQQVKGFAAMVTLTMGVLIFLQLAGSRAVIANGNSGKIINSAADAITAGNYSTTLLAFLVFAILTIILVFKASASIVRTVRDFTLDILPVKIACIDSDLQAQIITTQRAVELIEKARQERDFFTEMTSAARFLFFALTASLIFMLCTLLAALLTAVQDPLLGAKGYSAMVLTGAFAAQAAIVVTALGSAHLVNKSYEPAANPDYTCETDRITIIAKDLDEHTQDTNWAPAPDEPQPTTEAQWASESDIPVCDASNIHTSRDYELLADKLLSRSRHSSSVTLMAAETVKHLGVTIAVNVAIRIAQRRKRCMLVDADPQRQAICKVFNIDPDNSEHAGKSGIENLDLFPISRLTGDVSWTETIKQWRREYDVVMIYAPNPTLQSRLLELGTIVDSMLVFGTGREKQLKEFAAEMQTQGCCLLTC